MSRTLVRRHPSVPLSYQTDGFTLSELVITLAIAVTLSSIGISSFQHGIARLSVDSAMMALRTELMYARSEAIKRGQRVLLCRQGDTAGECAGSGANGRLSWDQGWLMFVDQDNDRLLDAMQGDELLRVSQPLKPTLQLKWNRGNYIAFADSGALGSRNGTFCIGHRSGDPGLQRELVLPHSGRLRTAAVACRYPLLP